MTNQIARVLIADDHRMVVDGLSSLLAAESDIEVVAQAADGDQVLELLTKTKVDVAVLDFQMPGHTGAELTRMIRETYPNIKVIICTMHSDLKKISEAIAEQPDGYILKDRGGEELVLAIRAVMKGANFLSPEVQSAVITLANKKPNDALDKAGLIKLTRREREVLDLLYQGLTSKVIAEKLFVAVSTVETHRRNLLDKTGSKNSRELIVTAMNNNWIQTEKTA